MKALRLGLLMGIIAVLTGCYTTGLSPREQGATSYSKLVYGLVAQQSDKLQPVTPKTPLKLGVAQIGETTPPQELIAQLQTHPDLISSVIELPLPGDAHGFTTQQRVDPLRKLGQQVGADYILMIGGNVDSRLIRGPLQVFDLLIIPMFLVPSKKVEVEAKAAGAFIDVKTGQIIFLISAASTAKGYTPTAYDFQRQESLAISQREVLSKRLADDFVSRLRAMK